MSTSPTRIVAYIREDERYASVRQAALETAKASNAQLILYDADAASRFASPLPTWWDGDGAEREFGDRLTPEELEKAGRHDFAEQVRRARVSGIEAWGWLPSSRKAEAFVEYADAQGADLLIVPEDLGDEGLMAKLRGSPAPGEIADKAERAVVAVAVLAEA